MHAHVHVHVITGTGRTRRIRLSARLALGGAEGVNGLKVNDNLASHDLYAYYDDADAPA